MNGIKYSLLQGFYSQESKGTISYLEQKSVIKVSHLQLFAVINKLFTDSHIRAKKL